MIEKATQEIIVICKTATASEWFAGTSQLHDEWLNVRQGPQHQRFDNKPS